MSQKLALQIKAIVTAIFLVIGLPVAARLLFLWLAPPYLNLSADPEKEFRRLSNEFQQDNMAGLKLYSHLRRIGIARNKLMVPVAEFFFSPNLPKYSECFLTIAHQHLDNRELAKKALLRVIRIDHTSNGKQAVGIFVTRYSDDQSAEQVASALKMYDRTFAKQQLNNLNMETHSAIVHASALATLGNFCMTDEDQEGAKKYYEQAALALENLDPSDQHVQLRLSLKSALYTLNNLGINQNAPEIDGPIQDGTIMRLSDFKKKVICLDFWGDW